MESEKRTKVLFICVHNSARSQMAEALLDQIAGNKYEAFSAGLEPGTLNPLAVKVLSEIEIDIRGKETKDVFAIFRIGELFRFVITVCDESSAEKCPIFPGVTKRLHWSFPDPSGFSGKEEERLAKMREVRDMIKEAIIEFVENQKS